MSRKIEELYYELTAHSEGLQKDLDDATRHLGRFSQFVQDHPMVVAAALGAALLEVGVKATEMAEETDRAMRRIGAALPTGLAGVKELNGELEELGVKTGIATDQLRQAAVQAAELGASSPEDVHKLVEAAAQLSDATGTSLPEAIGLLTQLRREFHLSGDEALATAAKLASAAQGKVSVAELLSAFQGASPIFQKFAIDVDTGTKAIIALVQEGYGTRQVRQVINQLDGEGIRQLAERAHIAGDALEQLRKRAEIVEGGTDRLDQKIKNDLSDRLEKLGTLILPHVNDALQNMITLLTAIQSIDVPKILQFIAGNGDALTGFGLGLAQRIANATQPGGGQNAPKTLGPVAYQTIGQPLPNAPRQPLPLTVAEKKALEEARQKMAELRQELIGLLATTEQARPKSEAFAESILKWKAAAEAAHLPGISADLAKLHTVLEALKRAEGAQQLVDNLKATNEAFKGLDDALAQFQNPLQIFDRQVADTNEKLAEQKKNLTGGELEEFEAGVANLNDKFKDLRSAIADALDTEKGLDQTRDLLTSHLASAQQLIGAFDLWTAKARDLRDKIRSATDPETQKRYKAELDEVLAVLKQIDEQWAQTYVTQEKAASNIEKVAKAFDQVARSVIAAAQAMGVIDDKTAAIAQNAVSAGEAITEAVASHGANVGADIQAITSLAALGKQLVGLGKESNDAKQRAKELQEAVANLFANLQTDLSPTKGNSLAERIAKVQQQYDDARNQVIHDLAGKKNQTEREKDLDKLNALEAERIAKLKEEYAVEQTQLQEDYKVRALRAKGLDAEADALEFAEQQQREYAKAVADGADANTLAALAAAQAAEAVEHAAKAMLDLNLSNADQEAQIHDVTDPVKRFAEKADVYKKVGGSLGEFLSQFDLTTPEGIAAMNAKIGDFFDEVKANPDAFDLAGLSIGDFLKALLDLGNSADSVASTIETAAQKISDAENQIAVADDILGTSAQGTIGELSNLYGIDLSQFDTSTQQGANDAIAFLQGLFKSLDPNDPNYKEKEREIQVLVDKLRGLGFAGAAVGAAAAGAGSGAAGATSATGTAIEGITHADSNRLADLYTTMLGVDRQQLAVQQQILAAMTRPIITGPILPPILPSGFGVPAPTRTASTGSGTTVTGPATITENTFRVEVQLSGTFFFDKATAQILGRDIADKISRELADRIRAAQQLQGDTSLQ